eukprot:scaffold144561_cov17-Prasinocladus_malaysianus.AAC.2
MLFNSLFISHGVWRSVPMRNHQCLCIIAAGIAGNLLFSGLPSSNIFLKGPRSINFVGEGLLGPRQCQAPRELKLTRTSTCASFSGNQTVKAGPNRATQWAAHTGESEIVHWI